MRRGGIGLLVTLIWMEPMLHAQGRNTGSHSSSYIPPPAWKSVDIGDFYFRRKDYPGALSRYIEATRTDPDYAPGYLGLGKCYDKMGKWGKALAAYQQYLNALPSQKQADEAVAVHKSIHRLEHEIRSNHSRSAGRGSRSAPK